ncbi:DUF202 domain-containing protein [Microbacterium indicum]|uniref:DUF202 domain-containing protein n=1 Tax=Microbacterium indicum TaxID=358100 RepID=UPI00040A5C51|nr:DUF202 domain-containing protein [Microbacterium indicum]
MSEIFDPGLQPERTLLAWRRTCLSYALGSLVAMRFALDVAGILAVVVGVVGCGLSLAAYFTTTIGYRRATASLTTTGRLERGGAPIAIMALGALALGAACVIFLLWSEFGA